MLSLKSDNNGRAFGHISVWQPSIVFVIYHSVAVDMLATSNVSGELYISVDKDKINDQRSVVIASSCVFMSHSLALLSES